MTEGSTTSPESRQRILPEVLLRKIVGMQERLLKNTDFALHSGFSERCKIMEQTVGAMATELAYDSLFPNNFDKLLHQRNRMQMQHVMNKALQQTNEAFSPYFTEDGKPINTPDNQYAFNNGNPDAVMKAAGRATHKYLPQLVQAAGINMKQEEVYALLGNVSFYDILAFTADQVHAPRQDVAALQVLSLQEQIAILNAVIPGNKTYTHEMIATLKEFPHTASLTKEQLRVFNLALRLANATWMVHQIHRAVMAGNLQRITVDSARIQDYSHLESLPDRGLYRPYDAVLILNYAQWAHTNRLQPMQIGEKEITPAQQALLSTTLVEPWKDVMQLVEVQKANHE